MSNFDKLEQDLVLESLDLYQEFDSSHFIANAKSAITNKAVSLNVNSEFKYYTEVLQRAIDDFSVIKLDKDKVKDFLDKVSNSDIDLSKVLTNSINTKDNTVFKPQYIGQYVDIVKNAINKSFNDELSDQDMLRFMTNEFVIKVEKQTVKTNLPYGITTKDLQKETSESSKVITPDKDYIKNEVIPFITKYDDLKKNTLTEANATLNAINETEVTIKAMLKVLDKERQDTEINVHILNKTNKLAYNSIRGILDIISYVSFMLIHKLNVISSNIISCNKLYDDVFNLSGGTITETLEDIIIPNDTASVATDLLDGKISAFSTLAENIYDYHKGMIDFNNIDTTDKSFVDPSSIIAAQGEEPYSRAVYDDILHAYTEISNGLNEIAKEGNDYLLVFDDLINKCGFKIMLQDKYQNMINNIDSMTLYDGAALSNEPNQIDTTVYQSMLSEVKDYPTNTQLIANLIKDTFDKMSAIQEKFATNVNGEYSDVESINELRIFMKDLREQYIIMTQQVASMLMRRLQKIGKLLSQFDADVDNSSDKVDNSAIPIELGSNTDITESSNEIFDIIYNEKVKEQKNYFRSLQRSYFTEKAKALRDENIVFEADDNNASNPTGNANNTSNNAAQQTNNGQANTANANNATKPVVTDNNQQANTNNTQNNTINNSDSLKDSIVKVFKKIVETITNAFKKQSTKNAEFISSNKEALTNRSYANTAVRVVPYARNVDGVIKDLNDMQTKINALTPQSIQELKSPDDLYTKTIQIEGGLNSNDGLAQQFTNYFTTGNTKNQPQLKEYVNNAVHDLVVTIMIPYCESYSNQQTLNNLTSAINNLMDTVTKKIDDVNTTAGQTQESVSIFTEANDPNKNTKASMDSKIKWISQATTEMCQSARTVLQNQNNDYLKILDAFRPKTTNGNANVSDGNDNQNQNNNQNTQSNNQPANNNQGNNQNNNQ